MLEEQAEKPATSKVRIISQLKFPLPDADLSFERHWEILKAYVIASKEGKEPVSYRDFGKLTVSASRISGNNKFFESIGLISGVEGAHGKYVPTAAGIAIQRELTWKKESNARARLSDLLVKSWFWESAKNLLLMREKASLADLIDQLGYDSGADPVKHKPSLRVLVEYLRFSELIVGGDEALVLGSSTSDRKIAEVETPPNQAQDSPPDPKAQLLKSLRPSGIPVLVGVLITPETPEDKIRKTIQIILEEIGRAT